MNKKYFLFGIVLILTASAGAYYFYSHQVIQRGNNTDSNPVAISVPFKWDNYFLNSKVMSGTSFLNPHTKDSIAFKVQTGKENQVRIPNQDVFLNNKVIGVVDGHDIGSTGFSPDNSYFVFKIRSQCGATCLNFSLNVIDIKNGKVITVRSPHKARDFKGNADGYFNGAEPYIESYTWNGSKLDFVFYFTGMKDESLQMFRISPKETWELDLVTGTYKQL